MGVSGPFECRGRQSWAPTDGSYCFPQPEEKQKATQQFSKLLAAMKVMGISGDEQKAFWLILGAIYHLGAAGATKGNELGAVNERRFGTDGCQGFQRQQSPAVQPSPGGEGGRLCQLRDSALPLWVLWGTQFYPCGRGAFINWWELNTPRPWAGPCQLEGVGVWVGLRELLGGCSPFPV